MVPAAEARGSRSSPHPQPGGSDPSEPGLGARVPQAAPAPHRVSAHSPLFPPLTAGPAPWSLVLLPTWRLSVGLAAD